MTRLQYWFLSLGSFLGILAISAQAYAADDELSINDAFVTEGNVTANLTIDRANQTNSTVTVDYATADDSATAGSDYTATSGTLTFDPGVNTATISVSISDDTEWEGDETFQVNLSNASGGTITDGVAVVTILNDDTKQPGEFVIHDASVTEGNTTIDVTLERQNGVEDDVSVDYATSDDTASAGSDYTSTSGTATISHGNSTTTISIPVLEDTQWEGDETLFVTLSNPTNGATISDDVGVMTIMNDDTKQPGEFVISDASITEADTTVNLTVQRQNGADDTVTVDYVTSADTATAGSDYDTTSGTLTFSPGETSASISVPIHEDATLESDETFDVTLSNPTNGATISDGLAVVTILDDEVAQPGTISLSADTYSVTEDGTSVTITLTRTGGSDGAVSVDVATTDGTATAGSDYTSVATTITWGDGDSTDQSFSVSIVDDAEFEGGETVDVSLSSPAGGASLGTDTAVLTIVDDETPNPGLIAFTSATYTVDETGGSIDVTIERTGGTDGDVTADVAASDATATAGDDYSSSPETLSWLDGESGTRTFTVSMVDDALYEGDETVALALSNATGGASLGTDSATLTITDDEMPAPGVLSFAELTYTGAENGGSFTVTVERTGGDDGAVSIDFATADGTAVAGSDYVSNSGTISFSDGDTAPKSFDVATIDDDEDEDDETVELSLSNVTGGATIGTGSATLTITDDEVSSPGEIAVTQNLVETDETAGSAVIDVSRTGGFAGEVSVTYGTSDGTATTGEDYSEASGTLTWTGGEQGTKSISVPLLDDAVFEGDETFSMTLSDAVGGAVLGDDTVVVTIVDDETPREETQPGTLEFALTEVTVDEITSSAEVVLTRNGGADGAVTVDLYTVDDSALGGQDFETVSTTLSWADGDDGNRSFEIPLIDDEVPEDTEMFAVALENAGGGALLGETTVAEVRILDDDEEPAVDTGGSDAGNADMGVPDTGGTADLGSTPDQTDGAGGDESPENVGCGCAASPGRAPDVFAILVLLAIGGVLRRRR